MIWRFLWRHKVVFLEKKKISKTFVKSRKTVCLAHTNNSRHKLKRLVDRNMSIIRFDDCFCSEREILQDSIHYYLYMSDSADQAAPRINCMDALFLRCWSDCYFCDEKCIEVMDRHWLANKCSQTKVNLTNSLDLWP